MNVDESSAALQPHQLAAPSAFVQATSRLIALAFVGCFCAAVLSLFARHWWLADLAANLRFQWTVGLAVVGLLAVAIRRWVTVIACVAVVLLQLAWFRPTDFETTDSERVVTVTTANVYTRNHQHERIVDELRRHDADVIIIVELSTSLAEHLTRELNDEYPHRILNPDDHGNFGIGLISRIPLNEARVVHFGNPTLPAVDVSLTADGRAVRLLGIHTLPPMGSRSFQHRNRYLDQVATTVRDYRQRESDTPVIVAGDLNLTPWSPFFHDFCNAADLQPFVGSAWEPTWYRFQTHPFGLVLDHILTTDDLRCSSRTIGRDVGSDHRFVTHELAWK